MFKKKESAKVKHLKRISLALLQLVFLF